MLCFLQFIQEINRIDCQQDHLKQERNRYFPVCKIVWIGNLPDSVIQTMCNDTWPQGSAVIEKEYHAESEDDRENDLYDRQRHVLPASINQIDDMTDRESDGADDDRTSDAVFCHHPEQEATEDQLFHKADKQHMYKLQCDFLYSFLIRFFPDS